MDSLVILQDTFTDYTWQKNLYRIFIRLAAATTPPPLPFLCLSLPLSLAVS